MGLVGFLKRRSSHTNQTASLPFQTILEREAPNHHHKSVGGYNRVFTCKKNKVKVEFRVVERVGEKNDEAMPNVHIFGPLQQKRFLPLPYPSVCNV